jgi:hypothetical protein
MAVERRQKCQFPRKLSITIFFSLDLLARRKAFTQLKISTQAFVKAKKGDEKSLLAASGMFLSVAQPFLVHGLLIS